MGNGDIDHAYWGRPEDMTMSRPAYYLESTKTGSDVTGATAAALAAGSMAFLSKGVKNHSKKYATVKDQVF